EAERGIMRTLLVANEANLKIKQIDYLGGIYLDLIAESPSPWEGSKTASFARHQLAVTREAIARELRRLLRGRRVIDNIVERPLNYAVAVSGILLTAEFLFFVYLTQLYYDVG